MKNVKILLNEAGLQFSTRDDAATFQYSLDGETVTFLLYEEARTGLFILKASGDATVDQSNIQEVTKYINIVNIHIPFGTFILTDCCRKVMFRDTLRVFDELPSSDQFVFWLEDCHSMFLAHVKFALCISAQYSAIQAIADLLKLAGA